MIRELEFASHPGNLACMRQYVRTFLEGTPLSSAEVDLIILGLDEACTNIIRYAYDHEHCHLIALSCERLENGVRFRLRDFGEQRDPARMQPRPLENVRPGGLGLHLIRKAFDEVDFNLQKQGTELVLTKRASQEPAPACP